MSYGRIVTAATINYDEYFKMKIKIAFVCIATLYSVTTLSEAKKIDIQAFVAEAKAELTKDFKDPNSATYRNVAVYKDGDNELVLCGEVNSKNSFGGYVGFSLFASSPGYVSIIKEGAPDVYLTIYKLRCQTKLKAVK